MVTNTVRTATTLPPLDRLHDIEPVAVDEFARDGHVAVRGLASGEEIAAYRPVIHDAALAHNQEDRPLDERDTYGRAFLQVPNLWQVDPGAARFTLAPRFAAVAARLLGVERVRLYHDQALFKEAGGGHTPWHQDMYYWPLDTDKTVTMWMPLVDVPNEVGSMTFLSGSHHLGDMGAHKISDESEASFATKVAQTGLPTRTHGAMAAGDSTFHAGWTLHRAPANPTGALRAVMTVIYFADGARVTEPAHDAQANDLRKWLPGCKPGGMAAGSDNPLVWPNAESLTQ